MSLSWDKDKKEIRILITKVDSNKEPLLPKVVGLLKLANNSVRKKTLITIIKEEICTNLVQINDLFIQQAKEEQFARSVISQITPLCVVGTDSIRLINPMTFLKPWQHYPFLITTITRGSRTQMQVRI